MTTRRKKAETPEIETVKTEPQEETAVKPKAKQYDDSWHRANGIPTCDRCGAPNPTDISGFPICPVADDACPRLNNG